MFINSFMLLIWIVVLEYYVLYVSRRLCFFLGKLILRRIFFFGEVVLLEMVFYILKLLIGMGCEFVVLFMKIIWYECICKNKFNNILWKIIREVWL